MEIIAESVVKGISYDTTVIATVIDDTYKADGKYTVSTGQTDFTAYSSSTGYRKNMSVYVNVPNGDYTNQKFIVGKYIAANSEPFIFTTPFETIVDLTDNIVLEEQNQKSFGLIANNFMEQQLKYQEWDNEEEQKKQDYDDGKIAEKEYNEFINKQVERAAERDKEINNAIADGTYYEVLVWDSEKSGEEWDGFDRLGIQAQFQTWLDDVDVYSGNYGLKLILSCKVPDTDGNFSEAKDKVLFLDSADDMYGNPYKFESFYQQEKVFDISELGTITHMKLYFYEVPGSFKDINGEPIAVQEFENLFMKDVYICLGYDLGTIKDEFIKIYTLDTNTFKAPPQNPQNMKRLRTRWIHFADENNSQPMVIKSDTNLDFEIRWYRYNLGSPSADEYSGAYWERINVTKSYWDNFYTYEANGTMVKDRTEVFKDDYLELSDGDESFLKSFNCDVTLDPMRSIEQFKVIILYQNRVMRSEVLSFLNEREVVNQATLDAFQALTIHCEDNTYGNYLIYNRNNTLLDRAESRIDRLFGAHFDPVNYEDEETKPLLEDAEVITWGIPSENTMISIPGIDYNNLDKYAPTDQNPDGIKIKPKSDEMVYINDNDENEEAQTNKLTRWVKYDKKQKRLFITRKEYSLSKNTSILKRIYPYQPYTIKTYYSANNLDNTIECQILKDGMSYVSQKELTFGTAGTTGTDVTFVIDFDNNQTAVTVDDQPNDNNEDSYGLSARLYNQDNEEVYLYDVEYNSSVGEDDPRYKTKKLKDLYKITWEWYSCPSKDLKNGIDGLKIEYEKDTGSQCKLIKTIDSTNEKNLLLNMNQMYVIKATLKGFGDYPLTTYLPIPLRKRFYTKTENMPVTDPPTYTETENERCLFISGATEVIYLSDGSPTYYKSPYKAYMYVQPEKRGEQGEWRLGDGDWSLFWYQGQKDAYLPSWENSGLDDNGNPKNNSNVLSPVNVYVKNATKYGVQYYEKINGEYQVVWTQPILVLQNTYPSTTLNRWDGSLTLDDSGNTILAATMAAGKKESSDNTFTGVALGHFGVPLQDADVSLNTKTGLYGFHHGQQSYAFMEDGTGFIGKDGKGRINFDGNSGTIYSSLLDSSHQGMRIDIDDGQIEMYGSNTNFVNITTYINKNNLNEKIKLIQSNGLAAGVFVYRKPYVLETDNQPKENKVYYDSSKRGRASIVKTDSENYVYKPGETKIYYDDDSTYYSVGLEHEYKEDEAYYTTYPSLLTNNAISDYNYKYITISSKQSNSGYPLSIGTSENVSSRNFRVKWDGTLYATNGYFTGHIEASSGTFQGELKAATGSFSGKVTATSGEIGGWKIDSNRLYKNGVELNSSDGSIEGPDIYAATLNCYRGNTITLNGTMSVQGKNSKDKLVTSGYLGVVYGNNKYIKDGQVVNGSGDGEPGIGFFNASKIGFFKITNEHVGMTFKSKSGTGVDNWYIYCDNEGVHTNGNIGVATFG